MSSYHAIDDYTTTTSTTAAAPRAAAAPADTAPTSPTMAAAAALANTARIVAFEEEQVLLFRWRGSVLPTTLPQVFFFGAYAAVIVFLQRVLRWPIGIPQYLIPVLTVVLGLLVAFRTNLSYDRYWEGRKLWSSVTSQTRSCLRLVASAFPNTTVEDRAVRAAALQLFVGFAVAVKHHLRGEHGVAGFEDMEPVVLALDSRQSRSISVVGAGKRKKPAAADGGKSSTVALPRGAPVRAAVSSVAAAERHPLLVPRQASQILRDLPQFLIADESDHAIDYSCGCTNIPLVIAQTLTTQIHKMLTGTPQTISPFFANPILASLAALVDAMTNLDRILTSKIPVAYGLHLKHILLLYVLALPFQIVEGLGWVTVPTVMIAAFTLFGIENIGLEIENPFGYDANDLKLDRFCEDLQREADAIVDTDAFRFDVGPDADGTSAAPDHEGMLARLTASMARRRQKAAAEAAGIVSVTVSA